MPALAIFLLSAASLAYEILLIRIFSTTESSHFAWMVISLALLGYGVGGTLLTLFRPFLAKRSSIALPLLSALFAVTAPGCVAATRMVPFNSLQLVWDPRQFLYLFFLYLLLAVPFACTSSFIALWFIRDADQIPSLYRADLIGAGAGAVAIVTLLQTVGVVAALRTISGLGVLAALITTAACASKRRVWVGVTVPLAILCPILWTSDFLVIPMSEFKPLAQALLIPGSSIIAEESGVIGTTTAVSNSRVPPRHAPGLSLQWLGELPEQIALFHDGGRTSVVNRADRDRERLTFVDFLPSALPYHLLETGAPGDFRVLVTDPGGGTEVRSALEHGASRVDVVEPNRASQGLIRRIAGSFSDDLFDREEVRVWNDTPRGFLSRSDARFDVIQWTLATPTGEVLDYHLTVEAIQLALSHLERGGLLTVTGALDTPPSAFPRLLATIATALSIQDLDATSRVVLIRGWETATLVVRNGSFDEAMADRTRSFCDERSFDIAWIRGISESETNRFNVRREPDLFRAASSLLGPREDRRRFIESYKLNIEPATDDRPWFHQSFRWKTLPEILALRGRGGTALLDRHYLVVVAALAQSVVAGLLLIVLPLFSLRGDTDDALPRSRWRASAFFGSIGLAFLMMEIAFIQKVNLVIHQPALAVAVVLSSFLVFAGVGAGLAQRMATRLRFLRGSPIHRTSLLISAVAMISIGSLHFFGPWLAGLGTFARIGAAIGLLAPLAFLMGLPFPLGLSKISKDDPPALPWVWGINGCASVVGAALAPLIAMHAGILAVAGFAAILYIFAGFVARSW